MSREVIIRGEARASEEARRRFVGRRVEVSRRGLVAR
jgi:hypothetical protein